MRTGDNRVATILDLYHRELSDRFPAGEVKAIMRAVFSDRLGWDPMDLELCKQEALSESELLDVYLPLKRIRSGEPLQYILGRTNFHGLELVVAPGVLIPRPETEELIELIIRSEIAPKKIVDIGTGSGCIALALKKEFPNASVIGIDVSIEALAIARRNGERLSIDVEWLQADILDHAFELPADLDLIVSNPPYVPRSEERSLSIEVRDHEPHLALFVEDIDPLKFYRTIADHSLR
ncbi:MAG: peptide chain release factor N(5)-glutamine methyltransferase, partial [Bacteroidota bacterium]|nr:peptide chain release factor N(5)-glutamine methyltransferase [Bacteroidota bacterium]